MLEVWRWFSSDFLHIDLDHIIFVTSEVSIGTLVLIFWSSYQITYSGPVELPATGTVQMCRELVQILPTEVVVLQQQTAQLLEWRYTTENGSARDWESGWVTQLRTAKSVSRDSLFRAMWRFTIITSEPIRKVNLWCCNLPWLLLCLSFSLLSLAVWIAWIAVSLVYQQYYVYIRGQSTSTPDIR